MKFGKMIGSKLLDEKWGVERYSMKADNIEKIISDIDCLPYRAILFDGTWGIGKSYAVNEALDRKFQCLQNIDVWFKRPKTNIS